MSNSLDIVYTNNDLFFGKENEENIIQQKKAIELYYWKKKINRAGRMRSKRKRKKYKEYLYGLRRI